MKYNLEAGDVVRVIGDVFPNVRGIVVKVRDDRADICFRCYYTVIEEEKEMWEMVSLPKANLVKVPDGTLNDKKYLKEEIPEQFKEAK